MTTKYTKVYQETLTVRDTNRKPDIFQEPVYRVYKRRWIILAIYVLYATVNSFQSFEYSIITNILMRYYGINSLQVDWTSIIYMALYMPLVIPASYIMDRKGLRMTALIGSIGTALGTFVKIFSINKEHFHVVYIGQIILSSVTVLIQPLPSRIAAVWFGPDQISLACGLGMFGTFLGQMLGLFIPPLIVKNHNDLDTIGWELAYLSYGLTAISVILALLVIIYFPKEPPSPPSVNQAMDRLNRVSRSRTFFWRSIRDLLIDPAFLVHSGAYGLTVGAGVAITTLFNQIFIAYFPGHEEDIGHIMLYVFINGTIANLSVGFLLDKFRMYYETSVVLSASIILSLLLFVVGLEGGMLWLVYISISILGFSINGYMLTGYELAVEMTYPHPESTSTGIVISISQMSGALLTFLLGYLLSLLDTYWVLLSLAALCFLCFLGTAVLPNRLRRQRYNDFNQNEIKL